MNFHTNMQVGARFKLIVRSTKDDKQLRQSEWSNNLVLDSGLKQMGVNTWINRCCVGSGNSTPSPDQTQLDKLISSTVKQTATQSIISTKDIYFGISITWRFGQGIATGNISEVGMGWADNLLWNRALVRDEKGNATTITVLNDEYLDVISEIRVYMQKQISGSFNLLNKNNEVISTHQYKGYPYIISNSRAIFSKIALSGDRSTAYGSMIIHTSTITDNPTTTDTNTSASNRSYIDVLSSKYSSFSTESTYDVQLSDANFKQTAFFAPFVGVFQQKGNSCPGYKFQLDPPIEKNNQQSMTYTFSLGWGRYNAT